MEDNKISHVMIVYDSVYVQIFFFTRLKNVFRVLLMIVLIKNTKCLISLIYSRPEYKPFGLVNSRCIRVHRKSRLSDKRRVKLREAMMQPDTIPVQRTRPRITPWEC